MARTLAGNEVMPDAGTAPTGIAQLQSDWHTLRARYPGDFQRMPAAVSWRREEASLYGHLAARAVARNMMERAVADYGRAIDLDPQPIAFWHGRFYAEDHARQFDRLVADCTRCLERFPHDWQAWAMRGYANRMLRRWREAETDLTQALAQQTDWLLWGHRGYSRLWLRDWEGAIRDYTAVIGQGIEDFAIRADRARAYTLTGDFARAARDYDRATSLPSEGSAVWCEKAPVQLLTGNRAGYRATCAHLLAQFGNTNDPAVANNIAWCCAIASNAVRDYAPVLRLAEEAAAKQSVFLNTLGTVLYRAGRYEEAIRRVEEGCALRKGGDPLDWVVLAMAHHRLNRAAEAHRWLKRAADGADAKIRAQWKLPDWLDACALRLMLAEARAQIGAPDP